MESLLYSSFRLIILLIEVGLILLLIDAILYIISNMFGFSWKKVLLWAATVFGALWLIDFLKKRNEKAQKEIITEITDADFETVEE